MKRSPLVLCVLFFTSLASADPSPTINITGTSLNELMNLKITSLSRKEENLNQAAAAAYVLTGNEIKRMGVFQLAEALRYVPGVEVALTANNKWAISIRGFNGTASNKVLAMIDGRNIYSTFYGGVVWQEQDILIDDIDRIEIIRGPGGTVWGANAVNGVINIITKSAKYTQGAFVGGGVGTANNLVRARVGGKFGENTYSRAYIKISHQDPSSSTPYNDSSQMAQSGFRIDHYSSYGDITLSGDVYQGGIGSKLQGLAIQSPNAQAYDGHNLLFNWIYNSNSQRTHKILAYTDYAAINADGILFDHRTTNNIDYQVVQRFNPQEVTYGLGYRRVNDDIPVIAPYSFVPQQKVDRTYSTFIQDNIGFRNDTIHFIVGTKYEHNDYTGSEWQPSVRGSYAFDNSLLWGAWSRAVRVPTRLEEDLYVPPLFVGNRQLASEVANVTEIGWRKTWQQGVQFDATAYTSQYSHLVTIESNTDKNKMYGHVNGVELSPSFQIKPSWVIRFNYSFAVANIGVAENSIAKPQANEIEKTLPKNMSQIVSMWDVNDRWQLNTFVRYVGSVPAQHVASYVVADASVGFKQTKAVHWQVVARNLGQKHYEWGGLEAPKVGPSVALYVKVKL